MDRRCRGFFHDRDRHVVHGMLVGFDLIPTDEGIWCVEANLNTGFQPEPGDFNPEFEQVGGVLDAAEALGMKRVVWVGGDRIPLPTWILAMMRSSADERGLEIEVLEDVRLAHRRDLVGRLPLVGTTLYAPIPVERHTLVARARDFGVGPDFVIANKEPLVRGLGTMLDLGEAAGFRVPRMSREPGPLAPSAEPGLPNLVYKYPDSGKGLGVHFLKARDASHAVELARTLDEKHGESRGLFQPYVRSRLLPGRRIYDVRAFVLVSPLGAHCAGVLRREVVHPVPDDLPEGIVEHKAVYASNMALGNDMAPVGEHEKAELWAAAVAVGEGLVRLLRRGFEAGAAPESA